MKKFNLKEHMANNKATFFSSLNEDALDANEVVIYAVDSIGKKQEINRVPKSKERTALTNIQRRYYDNDVEILSMPADKFDSMLESNLNEIEKTKPTTKMKKSEFKSKIKEMIVAEMNIDVTNDTKAYDFLAEMEDMLDEEGEFHMEKSTRISSFIRELNMLVDEYHPELYLNDDLFDAISMVIKAAKEEAMNLDEAEENEKDTAEIEDVTVDDTEIIDTKTTIKVDPTVKAVQDALTQAQAAAQKLGDPKLTDQIGNTITFFTRTHVVEKGAVAEADEMEEGKKEDLNEFIFPMLKRILK